VIVTRKRRKPFPLRALILPAIAIVLLAIAIAWPPSRNAIASGPLAPAWNAASNWFAVVATPFHFAAQNEVIGDRGRQIALLQSQLTAAQNAGQDKDKKIAALQQQIDQLQTQLATAGASTGASATAKPGAPAPKPATSGAFAAPAANAGSDLAAGATPDMKRTAQYWASMDPEGAAKVAQRLPPSYVARILALMQPETVGAILDAMPPTYAAKLTQEHPELLR
jgi:flagellar motility protein MotE (MotC chaperone)